MKGKGKNIAAILITMAIIAVSVVGGIFAGSKLVLRSAAPASKPSNQPAVQTNDRSDEVVKEAERKNTLQVEQALYQAQDPYSDPVAEAAVRMTAEVPSKKALVKVKTLGQYRFSDMFRQANGTERGYYDTGNTVYAYTLRGDTTFDSYGCLPGEVGGIGHPVTFSNAEHYNWLVGDLVISADEDTLQAMSGNDQYFMQLVIIDADGNASPLGARMCNSSAKSTHVQYYIGDLDEFTLGVHGWTGMTLLSMGFEVRMDIAE